MSFDELMQNRLESWYKAPSRPERTGFLAALVNKTTMLPYIAGKGISLPQRYYDVDSTEEINFARLPDRFVAKPNNSADSDGVMLFADGIEVFTGDSVIKEEISSYISRRISRGKYTNQSTRIIIEEFVQDYDERYIIPRDFKVYVAGGEARVVQVISRNGPKSLWKHAFYDREWKRIADEVQQTYLPDATIECPPAYQDLIAAADLIAADISCFYRLDFFMAKRGVVFGEFTSYPFAGKRFTPYGDKLMADLASIELK